MINILLTNCEALNHVALDCKHISKQIKIGGKMSIVTQLSQIGINSIENSMTF